MATVTQAQIAASLAFASIGSSFCVWAWVLTRPEEMFHDQGGLAITLIYFPATFCVWLLCTVLSAWLIYRRKGVVSEFDTPTSKTFRRATLGLITLGFCVSVGTLFLR